MTRHCPLLMQGPPPVEETARVVVIFPGPATMWPILSPGIITVPTHWFPAVGAKGRALLHVEPHSACQGCQEGRWVRWRSYIGVLHPRYRTRRLLELTPEAVACSPHLDPASGTVLRGLQLKIWRVGPSANSPLRCQVCEGGDLMPEQLPTVDVLGSLCRLYGVERWVLDATAPQPKPAPPPLPS